MRCTICNPPSIGDLPTSRTSRLCFHGLPKLKRANVINTQEVYIDAPNLENLCYRPDDMHVPFKLNFNSCRKLRWLHLWSLESTVVADKWLLELFSKFPLLESLKLTRCTMSERINISSAQLKVLELSYCSNLKEVNIDAPNVISCGYCRHGAKNLSYLFWEVLVNWKSMLRSAWITEIFITWGNLFKTLNHKRFWHCSPSISISDL